MQTNSAVRLQNNYSDINLSNGGGSIPEEYKPSGRSSDIKTVVQSNYSNVNQSQILQKTNDISTVQEKLETSSQRNGNNDPYLGTHLQSRRESCRLKKQQTVTRFLERQETSIREKQEKTKLDDIEGRSSLFAEEFNKF